MADNATQRAILDAEFYWFGGQLGAPRVFDSGTSFNAHPTLRGATAVDDLVEPDATSDEGSTCNRQFRYWTDGSDWSVTFEHA